MPYQAGQIILNGKYRLEALLGQGAFAQVYRATHLKLNAERAIKLLHKNTPGLGGTEYEDFHQRFQLEAQLGNRLDHPNLVRVFDLEQDGEAYLLVMEYAPGGSLAERLEQARKSGQPLPVNEVVRLGMEVAQGLSALHALEAVHRDLKPSNILFDAQGHARVADLGLAQVPGGPSLRSKLSEPQAHPGTPGYMSPEQERSGQYLRPASDVYALGIVLFEMLTGRNYHSLKPGTHARSLRADAPKWLDDLLVRMLAEEPKERPWDGAEVAKLLKKGIEQKHSVSFRPAPPAGFSGPGGPSIKRWMPWVGGVLLVVIVAVLAIVLGGHGAAGPAPTATLTAVPTTTAIPSGPPVPSPTIRDTPVPSATPAPSPTATLGIGSTWTRPADGMVMVYVPAGVFMMGDTLEQAMAECQKYRTDCQQSWVTDEQPPHRVFLDGYWMDKTDVTNAMYAVCVKAGVCTLPQYTSSYTRSDYYGNAQYANYPVINVDWNQAAAYCGWAGQASGAKVSLPSEAEWEKAARGTDGKTYPWGNASPDKTLLNYNSIVGDTTAVGSHPAGASPYGALDMAGNVWQWVNDWYADTYYSQSPQSNPPGPTSGTVRVLRGGSWGSIEGSGRSAYRFGYSPSDANSNFGFRCSRSLP